jgi:flagellar motor switch protein FliG
MVTWSDINIVGSRSLQEALSKAEGRELALALVDADPQVQEIIKENISERARDMLEEEISLLSSTKAADIEQAREKILDMLREMNKRGELEFEAN